MTIYPQSRTESAVDNKAPSKPTITPPSAATGNTHTVVKDDTISIGQVLKITGSFGRTPRITNDIQTNEFGTQWASAEGTFTVGSGRIMSRASGSNGGPFQSSPEGGWVYPEHGIKYDYILRQDGHIWIQYFQNNAWWILPVRE
ncbi:SH3 domain-containing protein [Salinicoccus sp. Marseille-QA3877]